MGRRWYSFNDLDTVKQHLSEVVTQDDLTQLRFDIERSGSNLTRFVVGTSGVWAVDCVAGSSNYRHIFMSKEAHSRFGGMKPGEGDALTVLKVEGSK